MLVFTALLTKVNKQSRPNEYDTRASFLEPTKEVKTAMKEMEEIENKL